MNTTYRITIQDADTNKIILSTVRRGSRKAIVDDFSRDLASGDLLTVRETGHRKLG